MFNLTIGESAKIRQADIYCLIIYDIRENKRRVELANLLEGYGERVQRSCFEVKISRALFNQLLKRIDTFYSLECEDNIIIYHISNNRVYRYNDELLRFDNDLIFL